MTATPLSDTPLPRSALLAWLTDAGPDVPMAIRSRLLDEIVGSRWTTVAGTLNGMLLDALAFSLGGGQIFIMLLLAEVLVFACRFAVLQRIERNRARGFGTPPDRYLMVAALWCGLQGTMSWCLLRCSIPALGLIAVASAMALVGPICARSYGAPRFAMFLIGLCYLPVIAATQTLGQPLLFVMVMQVPLLFVSVGGILHRYHHISVSALRGQAANHERAVRDPLTGLFNRDGFQEALEHRRSPAPPFTLLYLDLDGFKPINDTFGHQAGDLVLAEVSQRLLTSVRSTDVVARMGGDEFLIAMIGMEQPDGQRFAEQIVRRVSDTPYELEPGRTARIGVSVGYVCAAAGDTDTKALIRQADAALYEAKAAGKGVVRHYANPHPIPLPEPV